MSAPSSKSELRRDLAKRISALADSDRRSFDEAIRAAIAAMPPFRDADDIFAYCAFRDEPFLEPLMDLASNSGKRVFVPSDSPDEPFRFRRRRAAGDVEDDDSEQGGGSVILVLVPGRGFDLRGYRLGRGGGWYDRALPRLRGAGPIVGVAYDCQIVSELPEEAHDERMDLVVTEKRMIVTSLETPRA